MKTHLSNAVVNFERAMHLVAGRPKIPVAEVNEADFLFKTAQTQALISIAETLERIERKLDK